MAKNVMRSHALWIPRTKRTTIVALMKYSIVILLTDHVNRYRILCNTEFSIKELADEHFT
jgi:hypothetical protein